MKFSLNTVLETRRKNAQGRFSLKLRLTQNRKSTYVSVKNKEEENIYLTIEEWEQYSSNSSAKIWQSIRDAIFRAETSLREKYHESLEKGIPLKNILKIKTRKPEILTIFEYSNQKVEEHRKRDAHSTADSHVNAMTALKKFVNKGELYPSEITVELLKEFEQHLKQKGNSQTTIAIYERNIRTAFNHAIELHPKLSDFYPFSRSRSERRKIRIKKGSGRKGDALSLYNLIKFVEYKPPLNSSKFLAHRIWLFSYYCHGMNFKDIALLKYKNISKKNNSIRYVRSKTIDTETHLEELEIPINLKIQSIIDEFNTSVKTEDSHIFPLIPADTQGRILNRRIKNKTGYVNKWLKRICEDIKIPKITTYWARHTFATILKNDLNESYSVISELLGHSDEKTTQAYTKPRDLNKKIEIAFKMEKLLNQTMLNKNNETI